MSTDFKVTPEMVSQAATSCDGTAAELQAQLADLKTYVVNLEASWQGIAQNTFQDLMQEYDIYSRMLHDALTDIASGLRGNYVNYTDAEQQNIKSINTIQADLSSAKLS
ncbi:WXG100 family type VII secretion target [Streptomyces sp. NPDC006739]|uniref:WXG100 family type VII secretion target n=1 Tax=Streptomyces sp. NPDC006739 TaxID=3364763 RepID=UPI0036898242